MEEYKTLSGIPLEPFYVPEDLPNFDPQKHLGEPGNPPYTRGLYNEMYRKKLWYMRQFAGFNSLEETNERYRFLYKGGQRAFTPANHHASQMYGIDPFDPRVIYEMGVSGFPLDVMDDYKAVFKGIPLQDINVTIDGSLFTVPILTCMFWAACEEEGIDPKKLHGNSTACPVLTHLLCPPLDNLPPRDSMKLISDLGEYACINAPNWHGLFINGYVIREGGVNAYQELALVFAPVIEEFNEILNRGTVELDQLMSTINFNLGSHIDFFEEIAKCRAARRMWYKITRDRFKAKDPSCGKFRFHVITQGVTYTRKEPFNNVVRGTMEALASVLGGVNSLHVTSLDEGIGLPTPGTAMLSVRTQQILAYETGVAKVADPLAGSYYVEWLTNEIEKRAWEYLDEIEKRGGYLKALESGWIGSEFKKAQAEDQKKLDSGEKKLVGVNLFPLDEEPLKVPELYEFRQKPGPDIIEYEKKKREGIRRGRSEEEVQAALEEIRQVAKTNQNVIPAVMKAVKARAMLDEIAAIWRDQWGIWTSIWERM